MRSMRSIFVLNFFLLFLKENGQFYLSDLF